MKIRLNKFLSERGVCSRRKADQHILAGDIKVNGVIIRELGTKIDEENDQVEFQNKLISTKPEPVYYALNKPQGVVSTANDELGRQTVIDLVPSDPRVYPVGRLDTDSGGLIILTNDGELTQELTHPSFEHTKEYRVECLIMNKESGNKNKAQEIISRLTKGIKIDGKIMRVDTMSQPIIHNTSFVIPVLALHTGYNHQIRKMCARVGLEVIRLIRTKIGKLDLTQLELKSAEYKVIKLTDIL